MFGWGNGLAILLVILFITGSTRTLKATDYVLVVDTSGSMLWSIKGYGSPITDSNPQRTRVIRDSLSKWLAALPDDSRLSLISFDTVIHPAEEFHFDKPGERDAAIQWVTKLYVPPNGDTHLWATLREALKVARRYAADSPGRPVVVRIFTDGENDDKSPETKSLTMKQVLDEFPEVDGSGLRPDLVLFGDDMSMEAVELMRSDKRIRVIRNSTFDLNTVDYRPSIVWRPSVIVEGKPVSFFDDSPSAYKSEQWILDGQSVSIAKVLDVPSLTAGKHTVTLKVVHLDDQPDFVTITAPVALPSVPPPDASFAIDKPVFVEGDTIHFTSKESKEGYKHAWTVENGPTLSGETATWISDRTGEIKITHRITAPQGSSEVTQPILGQTPEQPDPSFSVDKQIFMLGDTINFQANKNKPDWKHEWIVGDEPPLTGEKAAWISDRIGQIKVTHRVITPHGNSEFSQTIVGQKSELPAVKFMGSPERGSAPLDVQFQDKSTNPDKIARYEWDFGDGSPLSTDKNPRHHFDQQGTYTVKLKVTTISQDVLDSSEPQTIEVDPPPPAWHKWIIPGIIALVALLVLRQIIRALTPKSLYGRLEWQYQGQKGRKDLSGTQMDLKKLGVPGWKSTKQHVIRNQDGIKLFTTSVPGRLLKNGQPLNVEGVTITFITNLK
jgi:PKD repeat protein